MIHITDKGKRIPIAPNDIAYVVGDANYSRVVLKDGARAVIISKTLLSLQKALPSFIRVSKGLLISPSYYCPDKLPSKRYPYIYLQDGTRWQVPRRRVLELSITLCHERT